MALPEKFEDQSSHLTTIIAEEKNLTETCSDAHLTHQFEEIHHHFLNSSLSTYDLLGNCQKILQTGDKTYMHQA